MHTHTQPIFLMRNRRILKLGFMFDDAFFGEEIAVCLYLTLRLKNRGLRVNFK